MVQQNKKPVAIKPDELDRRLRELKCGVPDSLAGVLPDDQEIVLGAARKLREHEEKPSR